MKTDERHAMDTKAMREAAREYQSMTVLPRYDVVKGHSTDFSRDLWALIDEIERLATQNPDEILVKVALAGVGEARRRLTVIERAGLMGEHERVLRLARSVQALCDHFETLTGTTMCLACDEPISQEQESAAYGKVSPSGPAVAAGRIHAACANRARPAR